MPKLEKWSIGYDAEEDRWKPPEQLVQTLVGEVYGHYLFEDGKAVRTSQVVSLDLNTGRAVTRSGTVYYLGEPSAAYIQWLEKNNDPSLEKVRRLSMWEGECTG